jgi:hypothetical protein
MKELDLELHLEQPDAGRDVGLHGGQRSCGFGDAAVSGRGGENGEVVDIHGDITFRDWGIQKESLLMITQPR